eukprot:scaffold1610_cov257-Pinguiococcus_pyrenoidosus.AAC.34
MPIRQDQLTPDPRLFCVANATVPRRPGATVPLRSVGRVQAATRLLGSSVWNSVACAGCWKGGGASPTLSLGGENVGPSWQSMQSRNTPLPCGLLLCHSDWIAICVCFYLSLGSIFTPFSAAGAALATPGAFAAPAAAAAAAAAAWWRLLFALWIAAMVLLQLSSSPSILTICAWKT